MDVLFWLPVIISGMLAGVSTGLVGVYIVGMGIPFLGVCVSHCALAGAIFGVLIGFQGNMVIVSAMLSAMLGAGIVGMLEGRRSWIDSNVVIGVLFSLTMGLAFLGIGLFSVFGRSDNDVRGLLWGSLTFCRWSDVKLMVVVAIITIIFVMLFYKELMAIMFSRHIAGAAGIRVGFIWSGFLVLTAFVLTVSFQTVGGLMIYSLLVNPATSAFQLVRDYKMSLILSGVLGGVIGVSGFVISAITDLPTGAMIVIFSSFVVMLSGVVSHYRHG